MANKLYRVSRTENEITGIAGPATITRADKPQLIPVVSIDENGNPDIENPVENGVYATAEDKQEILFVTDKVTEGDLNPITSNAVALSDKTLNDEIKQYINDRTTLDWDNQIVITNPRNITWAAPARGQAMLANAISSASNAIGVFWINNNMMGTIGAGPTYMETGPFEIEKDDTVVLTDIDNRPGTIFRFIPYKA